MHISKSGSHYCCLAWNRAFLHASCQMVASIPDRCSLRGVEEESMVKAVLPLVSTFWERTNQYVRHSYGTETVLTCQYYRKHSMVPIKLCQIGCNMGQSRGHFSHRIPWQRLFTITNVTRRCHYIPDLGDTPCVRTVLYKKSHVYPLRTTHL